MGKAIIIIKNTPTGGSLRYLDPTLEVTVGGGVVTGTVSGSTTSPSASGTVDPGDYTPVGLVLNYTAAYNGNVGDIVDIDVDQNMNATIKSKLSSGTVITGAKSGKVEIGANQCSLFTAANFDGKVSVTNGGVLIVTGATSMEGKIEATGATSVVLIDGNSHIEGKVQTSGIKALVIANSKTEGKVSSNNDNIVVIVSNNIDGDLEVLNAASCNTLSNEVSGQTNTPGCTQ